MRNFKLVWILSVLFCFSPICYGDTLDIQHKTGSTLKWTPTPASEVSAKANTNSGYGSKNSSILQDPFVNGAFSGYYNMMQGTTGNSCNMQEQQKQQTDYVKQQVEPTKD